LEAAPCSAMPVALSNLMSSMYSPLISKLILFIGLKIKVNLNKIYYPKILLIKISIESADYKHEFILLKRYDQVSIL
jgi:hypothetical protein